MDYFKGLKATNREVKPRLLWGIDTEDDSKGTLKQISVNVAGTDRYIHFKDRDKFYQWLMYAVKHTVTLIACNLEYDLVNLFGGTLDTLNIRLKNGGMNIVSAKAKGTNVTFYDTTNHFPFGVRTMGEVLDLPKLDMNLKSWEYVDRDAKIVTDYVNRMQISYNAQGANFNATLPSSAMDLYRRHYLPFAVKRQSDKHLERLFTGYYGGRVEVYNLSPTKGRIWYIDVNSMYPYVMQRAYPNPNHYKFIKERNFEGFGIASVTVEVPSDLYFPPLPYRAERLMFPVGKFSGTWSYDEIRALIERGGRVIGMRWNLKYTKACYPFVTYVQSLYKVKSQAKDEIERFTAKLFLNSLYGKMGERVNEIDFVPIDKVPLNQTAQVYGNYAFVDFGVTYPQHTNVIWSLYTTAYARLHLLECLEYIRSRGGKVLYCDTDSVIYQSTKPLHLNGNDLGQWKLEGKYDFAHFLGPKLYALRQGSKETVKAKGVPKDGAVRFFYEGIAEFSRPLRLRAILKRGLNGNLWINTMKRRQGRYLKRRVLDDGLTLPYDAGRLPRP